MNTILANILDNMRDLTSKDIQQIVQEGQSIISKRKEERKTELITKFIEAGQNLLKEFPSTSLWISYNDDDYGIIEIDIMEYIDNFRIGDFT